MTITEYGNEIVTELSNRGIIAELSQRKKNQKDVTSISINPRANMAVPTIYIDEMYSLGATVRQAVEEILRIAEEHPARRVDELLPNMNDYEIVRPLLKARLYWNNVDADVKMSAKRYGFEDLIIVPYIEFDMGGHTGAIRVNKSLLRVWDVTQKQVIDEAIQNVSNDDRIYDLCGVMGMPSLVPMYIVTNRTKNFGAISIISPRVRMILKEMFPEGYYVLPSSVHEVIVMSRMFSDEREALNLVKSVNADVLDGADKLSDAVYTFGY